MNIRCTECDEIPTIWVSDIDTDGTSIRLLCGCPNQIMTATLKLFESIRINDYIRDYNEMRHP